MRKIFIKKFYFQLISTLFIGFTLGIVTIWPGVINGKSRRCFFNILKDGSNGNVGLNTILSINPNYILKVNNTKNKYLKVLLIGDSCFRNY